MRFGPDFQSFWQAHLNDNILDYCRGCYREYRLPDDFTDRRFLQFVIRLAGLRRVLEIGGFIGRYFANAAPADGEVVSNGGIIKTGSPMLVQPVTIKFTDNVWLDNPSCCHVRLAGDNFALLKLGVSSPVSRAR